MAMMGRYELLRALKGGGMAEVFLGRRRGPGGVEKQLVVKRIRREYARDPRFIRLFLSEARLSMTLTHKNIVPVFDFGRAGDELFFVMEYVDGVDLARALKRGKRVGLDPIMAAFIAMEICQALDYAHRVRAQRGPAGVVHRDVTPRNLLLSYAGEVKLADFGVATLSNTDTKVSGVRGTPTYMSPEQAHGDHVDGRADLFSLGLVLFEMLSGDRAYSGTEPRQQLACAKLAQVPALSEEIPAELRAIVERATAAKRSHRFADAKEMQRALDRYVVSRRASDDDVAPPNQLLSTWLSELFPLPINLPEPVAASGKATKKSPTGSVVTFLDHGEEGIAQIADDQGTMRSMAATAFEDDDQGTMRSMAATAIEDDDQKTTGSTADGGAVESLDSATTATPSDNSSAQPRRQRRMVVAIVGVCAAVVGVAALRYVPGRATMNVGLEQRASAPVTPVKVIAAIDAAAVALHPGDAGAGDAGAVDANVADARRRKVAIRHPRRRIADAAVKQALGTLQVGTSPWAKVLVVGTKYKCADTPCTLTLPAGTYTIKLTNPVANVGKTVVVKVNPGKISRVSETLTRAQ